MHNGKATRNTTTDANKSSRNVDLGGNTEPDGFTALMSLDADEVTAAVRPSEERKERRHFASRNQSTGMNR